MPAMDLPVVDSAAFVSGDAAARRIVGRAFETTGFAVVRRGVPEPLAGDVYTVMKRCPVEPQGFDGPYGPDRKALR